MVEVECMNFFSKILFCLYVTMLIYPQQGYAADPCTSEQLPQKINQAIYQEALKEASLHRAREKYVSRSSSKYKKIVLYVLGAATLVGCAAGIYLYLKDSSQGPQSPNAPPANPAGNLNPPAQAHNANLDIAIHPEAPLRLTQDQQDALHERFRQEMGNHGDIDRAIESVCGLYPDGRFRFVCDMLDAHGLHSELDAVFPP